eukprot:scaffold42481_cov25-Phaeocystis_antarctica.AAC.1
MQSGRPRWRAAAARPWASRRPLCSVARWWPDGEWLCLALGQHAWGVLRARCLRGGVSPLTHPHWVGLTESW